MKDYGVVEVAGTPGYHSARMGLRAPRVAVRVEVSVSWESAMALALSAASTVWGGYGFIYIPHRAGVIHPALRRILHAYDPDYLVDLGCTYGDVEAMIPGWIGRNVGGVPKGKKAYAEFVAQVADQDALGIGDDDGPGSELCSPYREHGNSLRMHVLSESHTHPLLKWSDLDSTRPALAVPDGLDPMLTLALGKRAGFATKPPLPIGGPAEGVDETLPAKWVQYALSLPQPRRRSRANEELGGLSTAWDHSLRGLTPVARRYDSPPPIAVIGSTPEDFALAIALDRMYGTSIWIPEEWGTGDDLRNQVYAALSSLDSEAWNTTNRPVITSTSLSATKLQPLVASRWPEQMKMWDGDGKPVHMRDRSPVVLQAVELDLHGPRHYACGPDDYDRTVNLPTRADGDGGFEYMVDLPPETPLHDDLRGPNRPFWEVDVEFDTVMVPPGRNLAGPSVLAKEHRDPATVLRSGRDGVCLNPGSVFLVRSGASLTQSMARPRLHALGLREWATRLTAQHEPETKVILSQAGRRAMILARLWGSRSAVARDLVELHPYLREFRTAATSDKDAYPHGDGVVLARWDGYLTLAAAKRTLPGLGVDELRTKVNDLLRINVLQRGLVIRCSECERRAFHRIGLLSESNECSRCGAPAYATDARRSAENEPEWHYDLHGAVRELLEQNGDVPFLAGRALAETARTYQELAELDFIRPEEDPDEIDVLALVDGRLVIGETKCVGTLGVRREINKSVAKLVRTADLLGADEILLATTADGWAKASTDALVRAMRGHPWRFGVAPEIRVMINLREKPDSQLLEKV